MARRQTIRGRYPALQSWMLIALLSVTATCSFGGEPKKTAEPKTVRLLTIGNSFSRNATKYLNQLAIAGGHELIHRPIIVGGASMELHATKAAKHDANPDDADGKYADGPSLQELLVQEPWDVVTIQQASRLSPKVETYRPFAGQLAELVHTRAPQAKLLIHETWAYRADDPWFVSPSKTSGNPVTQAEMHQKLQAAYRTIAKELNAELIPVGDAFAIAAEDSTWGYRPDASFDFANAKPPALPDQTNSLHVGWRWKTQKGERSLGIDGHHANAAGEYLGSCVFYEVLFDDDVTRNSFTPPEINPEFATFLRETAHRAVADIRKGEAPAEPR